MGILRAWASANAGQALRSGSPVNLREPEREDKRHRASKQIISEGDYVAELNMRMGHLDPDNDLELIADIEAVLKAEYQQAYLNEVSFKHGIKKFYSEHATSIGMRRRLLHHMTSFKCRKKGK